MKCQKCGNEYEGKRCSNCGKKNKKPISKGRKILGIIVIVLGIYILAMCAIGWNEDALLNNASSSVSGDTQINKKVSYENFEKIENGMTYQQVVEIFGKEGKVMSETDAGLGDEYKTTIYYWYDDTGIANCNVTIQGGKVIAKAQVGLR